MRIKLVTASYRKLLLYLNHTHIETPRVFPTHLFPSDPFYLFVYPTNFFKIRSPSLIFLLLLSLSPLKKKKKKKKKGKGSHFFSEENETTRKKTTSLSLSLHLTLHLTPNTSVFLFFNLPFSVNRNPSSIRPKLEIPVSLIL